jgi:HSP20 family protein
MLEKPSLLQFFEDTPNLQARFPRTDAGEIGWLPAVDVQDLPNVVVIRAALPGVEKSDIKVEVGFDSLSLTGRRREQEGGTWVRQELLPGPFSRTLKLPVPVQAGQALASHKDGILEIRIPKEPHGMSRTVTIQ